MDLDVARVADVRYEAGDRRCVVSLSAMNSDALSAQCNRSKDTRRMQEECHDDAMIFSIWLRAMWTLSDDQP